jgi:hypothetical protein
LRSQAESSQHRGWEVTAADAQILAAVPQNICHLQRFSKPNATAQQHLWTARERPGYVRVSHLRPEFPNTSGDHVSVLIKLSEFLKRDNLPGGFVGKSTQVELHAFREGSDDIAYRLLIGLAQLRQQGERGSERLEKNLFI